MSAPAIIMICIWVIGLFLVAAKDGEMQKVSLSDNVSAVLISAVLLYWGGFFNG